jgi:hypothetical protein
LKEKREAIDARQTEIWQLACLLPGLFRQKLNRLVAYTTQERAPPENSGIVQPVEQLAESVLGNLVSTGTNYGLEFDSQRHKIPLFSTAVQLASYLLCTYSSFPGVKSARA